MTVDRRLKELEKAGQGSAAHHVSELTAARLKRVAGAFESSIKELTTTGDSEGWRREHKKHEDDISLAFRLADDHLQVVASKEFEGIDALHAFVALSEFDLVSRFCSKTEAASLLQRSGTGDSLWRVHRRGALGKEDNIMHVSSVDALDEQLGSLWVASYTPGMSGGEGDSTAYHSAASPRNRPCVSDVDGLVVPPPQEGCVRVDFWKAVFIISPIWGKQRFGFGRPPSCQLTVGICRRASSASCVFPSFVRKDTEAFINDYGRYMHECRDLSWRCIASPNALLYDYVREHLQSRKPSGTVACRPLSRMSCPELTVYLPTCWADFCEPCVIPPASQDILSADAMEYRESEWL